MTDAALARCSNVARTYGSGRGAVVALHRASCAIAPGDRIAIIGPSGSGKSTLLHLISGLDTPTTGTVTWPAIGPRDALRPGPVALVLQGPSLLPPLNVLENVALPLLLQGVKLEEANTRAVAALARLDLAELGDQLPEELSGGQAQRVSIARAISPRPRLLLADEPTGQLDQATAATIAETLVAVADEIGAALVVATHDLTVADHLDQVWSMRDGRLTSPSSAGGDDRREESCPA
ncbi:MAG TPA: ABC transporter ATP-binding protein [Acidimicrobiia bacterium]